jgi:hypothetical protein
MVTTVYFTYLSKLNLIKILKQWLGFRLEPIFAMPQLPQKLTLGMKMVKNDSITIILLLELYSRYVYTVHQGEISNSNQFVKLELM